MKHRGTFSLLLLILIAIVIPRLFFPVNAGIDTDEYKDAEGNYYLFQFDPYHFYGESLKGPGRNFLIFQEHALGSLFLISLIPVFYAALTALFLFFIIKELTGNPWAAFLGCIILAVNKIFFMATYRGYTDTNSLNHFFIVSVIYCVMIGYKHRSAWAIAACALLLFMLTWNGWIFLLIILAIAMSMYSIDNRRWLNLGILACFLLILPYRKVLSYLPYLGSGFRITHEMAGPCYHPFILVILAALFFFLLSQCRGDVKHYILLSWFSVFLIASMFALRHTQHLIPPLAITLAILADKIRKYQVLFILLCSVMMLFLFSLEIMHSQHLPHMDDTVLEAMEWIKANTSEDIKIMSWWDYGHIYSAYSGREVMYRGHEPRGQVLEELAAFLLSPDSSLPDDTIFIANSADLEKREILEYYSSMNLTMDSTIMRVLREGRCFEGTKRICLWGE